MFICLQNLVQCVGILVFFKATSVSSVNLIQFFFCNWYLSVFVGDVYDIINKYWLVVWT